MTGSSAIKFVTGLKAASVALGAMGAAIWLADPTTKVALIAACPATITSLIAAVIGFINRNKIREVHLTLNSRLDELLRLNREQAHSDGRLEGIESEQARMRPADSSPSQTATTQVPAPSITIALPPKEKK